ncbi:MAG: hypothetical protein FJX76_15635 [Armatimonadetes bacterium]|nr:hypothetical protein [Armatimonadota bacterium]
MRRVVSLLLMLFLVAAPRCAIAQHTVQASDVLPPALLKSGAHTVDPTVRVFDWLYVFTVRSQYGTYEVTSIPMLQQRVHEIGVLAAAAQTSNLGSYATALQTTNPVQLLAVSQAVNYNFQIATPSQTGWASKFIPVGNYGPQAIMSEVVCASIQTSLDCEGQANTRRQLASQWGLDVYTTNPQIQQFLASIVQAQATGTKTGSMTAPAEVRAYDIPGTQDADVLAALRDKTPGQLNSMNDGTLRSLGVDDATRSAFLTNPFFSPRHLTVICANLKKMKAVDGLENYLGSTLQDSTETEALFAMVQSGMIVKSNSAAPLANVRRIERIPMCFNSAGNMYVFAPLEYLFVPTQSQGALQTLKQAGGTGTKTIVITGTATADAKALLTQNGFSVVESFLNN